MYASPPVTILTMGGNEKHPSLKNALIPLEIPLTSLYPDTQGASIRCLVDIRKYCNGCVSYVEESSAKNSLPHTEWSKGKGSCKYFMSAESRYTGSTGGVTPVKRIVCELKGALANIPADPNNVHFAPTAVLQLLAGVDCPAANILREIAAGRIDRAISRVTSSNES